MSKVGIDIVFDSSAINSMEIWKAFSSVLNKCREYSASICKNGKKKSEKQIEAYARKLGYDNIEVDVLGYGLLAISFSTYQLISIRCDRDGMFVPWCDWIEVFRKTKGFIQAWVCDREYVYWQGVQQIEEYEKSGRDHSHLPKIPSGSPPPCEQIIIDILVNPSRRVIRKGFVEAIGHVMWIGDGFWERSGAIKHDVLAIDWAEVREEEDGIVYLKTADDFFTDNSPQGIQHKLRKLLYPRTCNLPPRWGSWDGWIPTDVPPEGYVPSAWQEKEETFPVVIEMRGEQEGRQGVFRLTRKTKDEAVSEFIPDDVL